MDMSTIGILGGMLTLIVTIMLTITIYLDRVRRSGIAAVVAAIDKRFERSDRRFEQVDKKLDELTRIMVALAKDVGEMKGRLGILVPVESYSAVD